jgi:NAD(P)-dependent dehydrogenase (short-subunit alcohol dehydrogenase family)
MDMDINGSIALVTGANRGFGRELAQQLLQRGAAKVYATARNPDTIDLDGVVALQLDITDPESVRKAAEAASDVTLLINNAGISTHTGLVDGDMDNIRLEMETHFFGPLAVTRAFAPVIAGNGGGAILNVLSVLSWLHIPSYGAYGAGKAAAWAMSGVVRNELAGKNIGVTALHVGYMDTDMASYVEPDGKSDPVVIAAAALDGIEAGATEVVADELSRQVKQSLASAPALPEAA